MLNPLRLVICLLATLALLASGCGSSKTTTTHTTASASGATGITATANTPATTPPTKSTPATKKTPATQGRPAIGFPAAIQAATPKQAKRFNEAKEVQHLASEGRISKQAAKARRVHIERQLEKETFAKVGNEAIRHRVPTRRQFPTEVQTTFVTGCTEAKTSIYSCECILSKFEEGKGEKSLRIGEAIYTEARMRLHESLPRRIKRIVEECRNAHA